MADLQREPTSDLLKRFSQDMVQCDDLLPATVFDTLMVSGSLYTVLSSLFLCHHSPSFLPPPH